MKKKMYLDNLSLYYLINESNRSRSISLKIKDNYVLLTIPRGVSYNIAENFLLSKFNWCYSKILNNSHLINKSLFYVDGYPGIFFLGKQYGLTFKIVSNLSDEDILLTNKLIYIKTTNLNIDRCYKLLKTFFVNKIRKEVEMIVSNIEKPLKVRHKKIFIKEQATRWGSCSSAGNLSFNWRLILAPKFVLTYVVYHEVLHLKIPNHSKQFWDELKELYPRTDEAKIWLKQYSFCLRVLLNGLIVNSKGLYNKGSAKI